MAWTKANTKHLRRAARTGAVVALAAFFAPVMTLFWVVCGVFDVCRHRSLTAELVEKYFTGNGIVTWLLAPVNLLADLFSHRNPGRFALADLPAEHRAEIEACVRAFRANGDRIRAHIDATAGDKPRSMLAFKWYNTPQSAGLHIPEFERGYRYIKTIAVSVFREKERTSRHFGPLRLTFRVLYNLDPVDSRAVSIEVDGQTHYWKDDPLFIFDDTFFHQSVNDLDATRYCLFMDIVRPNHLPAVFDAAVRVTSTLAGSFNRMFYKNWSFVR